MPNFKTETQIYADVEAYLKANVPGLTAFTEGSPERALARLVAFGLTMAWKILFLVYQGIWATTADYAALRNWYEVFGLAWNGPGVAEARRQVIAKFRERTLGTAGWYEDTAVAQFDEVTEAHFFAGRRGCNTGDLLVLHYGNDCLADTKTAVQSYFDNPQRKVLCMDLTVITRRDLEEDLAAAAVA